MSTLSRTLRKHTYSNIKKISPPNIENFQIKNSDVFHSSAQNIDFGYSLEPPRRGGSNEYPQSMFLNKNKKNNVYPCKTPVLLYNYMMICMEFIFLAKDSTTMDMFAALNDVSLHYAPFMSLP